MILHSNGNNANVIAIVNIYFEASQSTPDKLKELADNLVRLIIETFPNEVKHTTKDFSLPYKDITDVVFYSDKTLLSDSIQNFADVYVINSAREHQSKTTSSQGVQKKCVKQFMIVHEKLVQHILLAQSQRDFIKNMISTAKETAEKAEETATKAKKTAEKARNVANKAEEMANKADETYKSMFANYITILGVFTAIIVTIFGGLNVIDATMSNISQSRESVVFIVALLVLCEVLLLYFLANVISWITKSRDNNLNKLFGAIVAGCVIVILITGILLK